MSRRVGMDLLHWDADQDLGPASRPGTHIECSAERRDALADAVEPEARPLATGDCRLRVEAPSVVPDPAHDFTLGPPHLDRGARGAGVAGHIAQRFLSRAVERGFDR